MKRVDLTAGVIVLALATLVMVAASRLPIGRLGAPDSGFVPLLEGSLLAIAGLVLVASGLRGRDTRPVQWPRGDARRMVLHLALSLFGYVFVAGYLGYFVSTLVFLFVATAAWRRYSWKTCGLSALTVSLVLLLVFGVLLRTPLPSGPLGLP